MFLKFYTHIAMIASAFLVTLATAMPVKSDPLRGKELFVIWCASCHQIAPEIPTQGPGPSFPEIGSQPRYTRDYLKGWITIPHSRMPHFLLTNDKLEDIVNYILSFKNDMDATGRTANMAPPLVRYAQASGFYVSKKGHVLTAAQVTRQCKHITIGHRGEILESEAYEVSSDPAFGLALLKTDTALTFPPASGPG